MADDGSAVDRSKVREPPSRQDAKATEPTSAEDFVARQIVDAAVTVHTTLGPGLLESVYEVVLAKMLTDQGIMVRRQVPVPIQLMGLTFDSRSKDKKRHLGVCTQVRGITGAKKPAQIGFDTANRRCSQRFFQHRMIGFTPQWR